MRRARQSKSCSPRHKARRSKGADNVGPFCFAFDRYLHGESESNKAGHEAKIFLDFAFRCLLTRSGDPSRKLRNPKNLRPKDKQILTWDQLADVLKKATGRDRLIILLDMTEALRPSELFAIRWRTFDGDNTLDLTATIYRAVIRPFGKTPKSLGKMHLHDDLVTEPNQWKLEVNKHLVGRAL